MRVDRVDNIPPWMVNNYAHLLAAPVTAIFNSSLKEGKLPDLWKTATVVPVPKKHPPGSLENDIRPISLTPILAKAFEGIVLNWVDDVITPQIDERQFGGLAGTGTTDALVEMFHSWCEATDKPDSFVRVLLVDYSKAFDHINHYTVITRSWRGDVKFLRTPWDRRKMQKIVAIYFPFSHNGDLTACLGRLWRFYGDSMECYRVPAEF